MAEEQKPGEQAGQEGETDAMGDLKVVLAEKEKLAKEKVTLEQERASLQSRVKRYEDEVLTSEYLDFLAKKEQPKQPAASETVEDEPDFDGMTNAEIVKHLSAKTQREVARLQASHDEKYEKMQKQLLIEFARQDLEHTKERHADMAEKWTDPQYQDLFFKTARENPSDGAEQVYKKVKYQLWEKAQEEETRATERKKKEQAAEAEKGGIPPSLTKRRDLSALDAARAAYRRNVGTTSEG